MQHGKMSLKVMYLVVFLLFAWCVTINAVDDHFESENGESNEKFSQQSHGPVYTYQINK